MKGLYGARNDSGALDVPGTYLLPGMARCESAVQADHVGRALGCHSAIYYHGGIYAIVRSIGENPH